MLNYEDFHIVANQATSDRVASLLQNAGVRIHQRIISEVGRPEYVIAVHLDDFEKAEQELSNNLGPGRTFSSNGE